MNKRSLWLFIPFVLFISCGKWYREKRIHDFPQILQADTLRVLTLNTSTSYFIYRDQPMGYHYDMIFDFCKQHGLVPEIIVAENTQAMIKMLQLGVGDMIAYNIPVTNALKDSVRFAGLQHISHQVLVQRALPGDTLITDVIGLIGKKVTVIGSSKYRDRLENLNNELGGGIQLEMARSDTLVAEDLIRSVSRGEIAYTVADDDLARLDQTYFRNLNVDLPVSFEQRSSWVVRKDAPVLADSLDSWFEKKTAAPGFLRIEKKYFEETKGYPDSIRASYEEILGHGVISPFDKWFRQEGKRQQIDWRLLASVAWQESSFKTEGESWAGAIGLMGLMPATAGSLGLSSDDLYDPEANIRAGAEYLRSLLNTFDLVTDPNERLRISLAAYNGGVGHVFDARALAEKYGANKNVWAGNVEKYIHLKRLEQYYTDPVCKYGYFRADETINYVANVIDRWEYYRRIVPE
ncbi:MAG: transglycosylase SLT domain-containing protein [Porphyromonadaceae bacterium]|nr:transglycosylase SLT domain-containing protein [Porphyromonadaceae bacterium]